MNQDKTLLVSNIQRFCLHDGPGIRTTVFFKGCTLHCPWCANPENISFNEEDYRENSEYRKYGRKMTSAAIFSEINKDKQFYETELSVLEAGGVTYSGGEPLYFIFAMSELLKKCKNEKIRQCIETSLFVPEKNVEKAIGQIDFFIIDMKIMESDQCGQIIGGNLQLYKENLMFLDTALKKSEESKPYIIRIPLIKPYITNRNNIYKIVDFIVNKGLHPHKIELIEGHNLGEKKWRSLGRTMYRVPSIENEEIKWILDQFNQIQGIDIEICSI